MKTQIKAEIVAHSINEQGDELISVLATFPRIILSEVNTHRMLSKNTSSSRAIPFNKMVEAIENNPFIPIAWQKEHSGMQGTEYFTSTGEIGNREAMWLQSRNFAVQSAKNMHGLQITKQLSNRLLEPFMWTTMLITGPKSGWDNFFKLRCPNYDFGNKFFRSWKDVLKEDVNINPEILSKFDNIQRLKYNKGQAEIHMMALAENIYDAVNESTPKQLKAGEWHIPFEDKMNIEETYKLLNPYSNPIPPRVKISTAMAAHTSYTIVGGEAVKSYEKWIELHDKLIAYDPPHSSPMEHCARVMSNEEYYMNVKGFLPNKVDEEGFIEIKDNHYSNFDCFGWCNNFKGFIPYRYMVDNKLSM